MEDLLVSACARGTVLSAASIPQTAAYSSWERANCAINARYVRLSTSQNPVSCYRLLTDSLQTMACKQKRVARGYYKQQSLKSRLYFAEKKKTPPPPILETAKEKPITPVDVAHDLEEPVMPPGDAMEVDLASGSQSTLDNHQIDIQQQTLPEQDCETYDPFMGFIGCPMAISADLENDHVASQLSALPTLDDTIGEQPGPDSNPIEQCLCPTEWRIQCTDVEGDLCVLCRVSMFQICGSLAPNNPNIPHQKYMQDEFDGTTE